MLLVPRAPAHQPLENVAVLIAGARRRDTGNLMRPVLGFDLVKPLGHISDGLLPACFLERALFTAAPDERLCQAVGMLDEIHPEPPLDAQIAAADPRFRRAVDRNDPLLPSVSISITQPLPQKQHTLPVFWRAALGSSPVSVRFLIAPVGHTLRHWPQLLHSVSRKLVVRVTSAG